ncbi:PKD domain-containing protein [Streptacidiphilus fuscans]|uniref:CHAP domain-containing protein n=1 Tax=Streptacidiphilus fuscans TaxID=2789292 RepID=A0A931FCX2_9ACTN|nr:PKD domain-containing protein [Streptacidiphilus fuscans]MBF9066936.1 CHAP domain-containing protein [Streptacidiphilus fuscans]
MTGRHLPPDAVAGVRAGSIRTATDPGTGTQWAEASFLPATQGAAAVQASFQDGAGTGVFTSADSGRSWRLVGEAGPLACGLGLPQAVRTAWGLAGPACAAHTGTAAMARASTGTDTTADEGIGGSIARIALGQVGLATTPAVTSFNGVDCDPFSTLDGAFSPNSNGCGSDSRFGVENENESWCSDFAKWAWMQAGVTQDVDTLNAGSVSFYAWALQHGQSPTVDGGTAAPGDAVVFFPPGPVNASRFADHVGIVSAVNADGTVDLVDGDFLGPNGITAEYDTHVSLTSWAAGVWGAGEQWVIVQPPSTPQASAPTVSISGPHTAVAGAQVHFDGNAAQVGGTVTQFYWTFGDGRDTNTATRSVDHVFPGPGVYTVTLTATSSLGTATVRTWTVDVSGSSSTVVDVPDPSLWYSARLVDQYLIAPAGDGTLAAETSDGVDWLRQTVPGQPSPVVPAHAPAVASLGWSDPAAADARTPHAFYRAADGTLAETSLGSGGWTTTTLPGSPAPGSAIVAAVVDGDGNAAKGGSLTPEVFFYAADGRLAETVEHQGDWTTSELPGPPVPGAARGSLAIAATGGTAVALFRHAGEGVLTVTQNTSGAWTSERIGSRFPIAHDSALSAVTEATGRVAAFYTDAQGRLTEATSIGHGGWSVTELPGSPAAGTPLTATTALLPSATAVPGSTGATGVEVSYLTASGAPGLTAWDGSSWSAVTLPGTADGLVGVSAYPQYGHPQQVFMTQGSGLSAATSATLGAAPPADWTLSALPSQPSVWPDEVLLYAATPADAATAQSAAAAAGLPASQVTRSFASAWAAGLTGRYLVVAVGAAATDALYFNVCGWSNPSGEDPGATPFYTVAGPLSGPAPADSFENAAAATPAQSAERATDLTYFTVHGTLPPGEPTLPAAAAPTRTCSGTVS